MSKDRAAPFSRKHRRYWLPVTGGMLLIGAINVALGYCSYDPPPPSPQKIELVLPPANPGYTPESKPSKWRRPQPEATAPTNPAQTAPTTPPPPPPTPDAGMSDGSAAPPAAAKAPS